MHCSVPAREQTDLPPSPPPSPQPLLDVGATLAAEWSTPAFRAALVAYASRGVPPDDADDLVQETLLEALQSVRGGAARGEVPFERVALRKWIWKVLRNNVIDHRRRVARREALDAPLDEPVTVASVETDDQWRWAERELPSGVYARRTFEWLRREAEGERVVAIAADVGLPVNAIKKRMDRQRRYFRRRWDATQTRRLLAFGIFVLSALLMVWSLDSSWSSAPAEMVADAASNEPTLLQQGAVEHDEGSDPCARGERSACGTVFTDASTFEPAVDVPPPRVPAPTSSKQPGPLTTLTGAAPAATRSTPPRRRPRSRPAE